MVDPYGTAPRGVMNPADKAFAITPNDSTDLAEYCRALYVGGAGNVSVLMNGDSTPTVFVNVAAGSLLPLRIKRVRATDTTATNLVGVY